ncbi:MAG TPA: S8 family serine peptidase [Thermoanaerobaculia bacterium]|nr:S8 family serine peptidase [Thermoanaerobaculia bacterium]
MRQESTSRAGLFCRSMRALLALVLLAPAALANDSSYTTIQSGSTATPVHDRGIRGEGQIIAVLDTGADWTSCYFAEADGSRPPVNTGTQLGGLEWRNIDLSRRKIVAYNFLFSCDQFPYSSGCDDPDAADAWDNHGHGTHAAGAAAADKGTPLVHDEGDAVAPGAKLVIQDGGYTGGDACSHRPGFGCPVFITPILDQAYRQGARIHSNSWGDRQGFADSPPTANYSQSAYDVDAFVWNHPDMLLVFNTGNYPGPDFRPGALPPESTVSAPGSAKNTLQVGGTRGYSGQKDDVLADFSAIGPTRDGRIKPDVVGPAYVSAAHPGSCLATEQEGTSWAAPTIAGAAALVRQYYMEGFYPGGAGNPVNRRNPSAALLKATIIAAARHVPGRVTRSSLYDTEPVPSYEQGFGFPVLDDALYFAGDRRRLRVYDVQSLHGLQEGEGVATTLEVRAGSELKAVLVWTDPPGRVAGIGDATPQLVNDLDLLLITPQGTPIHGNDRLHPGQPDRLNNVEAITIESPEEGRYSIAVSAARIGQGTRQGYALVITGDFAEPLPRRRAAGR